MNKYFKIAIIGAVALGILVSGISLIFAMPGASDDPIISKSYITKTLMPELENYVNDKIASSGSSDKFIVVSVDSGKKFYGKEGTEFILRMGSGRIIASQKGGVANITSGVDLPNGTDVPSNSMLIVPLGDGRGFEATADSLIMVKGGYDIK